MRLLPLLLVLFVPLVAGGVCGANPYCVAGYGVLNTLGMPAACTDYNWNWLQEDRPIQMVRPNHYYNYIGIPWQWWDYNELTDQINDPARLSAWAAANTGRTWIIGNEPDITPQDGLTKEQYVRMYKRYYDLIKAADPTAKFCIGAITGGTTAERLAYTKTWYQDVLNLYRANYGVTMPIDVWNIHTYLGPAQVEDPDRIINEFVNPFVDWCHTVESGAYAGCEVWITELPLGEWIGALSSENLIDFMRLYMPRLERTGITKFFWYVSSDWDGGQGACALTRNGQPTAVGQAYAALAHTYPNAVPPVVPFVPGPSPAYVGSDFSAPLASPWFVKGGYWGTDGGALRHTGIYPFNGTSCCLLYKYGDVGVCFRMKINSSPDPMNWAGVVFRAASRFQVCWDSGYLFLVRQNGEAALYNKVDGTVISIPGAVVDPGVYHDYRIVLSGGIIKVYIDGALALNWTDFYKRFTSGYILAQAHRCDASYDDFHVLRYPTPFPRVTDDGVYTLDLDHLHASWVAQDPGNGIAGYRYAVGTSPGAVNVLNWTYTTETSAAPSLPLTSGSVYYFTVKAVYADGLESSPGTSDGIVAVLSTPRISQVKRLPLSTYVLLEDKVVSGVFPECAYIQEPDRTSGIRVKGLAGVEVGDRVSLTASAAADGKEAALQNPTVVSLFRGAEPRPVAMSTRSAGGSGLPLQAAPVDDALGGRYAVGLSPTGLLVRTAGKVSYVDPAGGFAYIDDGCGLSDGSGHRGIRLSLVNCPTPSAGAAVVVTACCGAADVGGKCARLLRPRSAGDVRFSGVDNLLCNAGFESGAVLPWTVSGQGGAVRKGAWYMSITAHSGSYFYGVYGNYATYSGYLSQSVSVPAGSYRASVWSRVLHGGNGADAARSRIGIDPTGGTDPDSPDVQWSAWDSQETGYYSIWREISTPAVSTAGGKVSVYLQYAQQEQPGWHINCFDNARLVSD